MKKFGMCFLVIMFVIKGGVFADWPMPGHDPQRSSWASEDSVSTSISIKWTKGFDAYTPARVQIITSAVENKIYVTAADGIYALDPLNGNQLWKYPLALPPGNAPTYVDGVLYVACLDKTIHAIDASTGDNVWQTDEAGGGYYVNPIVVNNKVYAGSLDGYFYCFDVTNGSYLWSYEAGEPIEYSPAFQTYAEYPEGIIFFAAKDLCAHAIRADTGQLVWKTAKLPGIERFQVWWPVIFDDLVMFRGGPITGSDDHNAMFRSQNGAVVANQSSLVQTNGWYDLQHHIDWKTQYPYLDTVHVLNRTDGTESQKSPILHCGAQCVIPTCLMVGPNPAGGGTPSRLVWCRTVWENQTWFTDGRFVGWQVDTALARIPNFGINESCDEGEDCCIVGTGANACIVTAMGSYGEAGWPLGILNLNSGSFTNIGSSGDVPGTRMSERKYKYWGMVGSTPVPLNSRIYKHSNCTVACFGL